jgi:general secretion pathway protein E
MELGVPAYLINATLLGVLAQRLVRTLCSHCKQPDDTAARETLAEVVKPWQLNGTYKPFKAVGCVDCRMTGFMGRTGLYELLVVSEPFKALITREPNADALKRQAVADGMRPLRLAGALRVAEGVTLLDEVLSSTPALR